MAAALMIVEFARRHIARGAWGRIIGLTSGGASASLRRSPTVPRRPPR